MILVEKSIYEPKSKEDGFRVLVMQYWPRGVKKEKIDVWFRELGTSKELIRKWKAGKLTWAEFRKEYLAGLKDKEKAAILRDLAERSKSGNVTLLCSCRDASRCHRSLLKERIQAMI